MIVSDYTMPEGYGNWLLRRLKENSATKDVPVIMMTGRTLDGKPDHPLERTLLRLGATAYLFKPLDFNALLAELKRHIVLQQPATQVASAETWRQDGAAGRPGAARPHCRSRRCWWSADAGC